MTETYCFSLPLSVTLPRKTKADKKIMLNLNVYRNLHYKVNNEIKQQFEPLTVSPFKAEIIEVSYYVYKSLNRTFDTMNVISVVDKFFMDWLVKKKMIPEDTCNNVQYGNMTGKYGCDNNHVIAMIKIVK